MYREKNSWFYVNSLTVVDEFNRNIKYIMEKL